MMRHSRRSAVSLVWSLGVALLLLGPNAFAHVTSGNRDNWGQTSHTRIYDPDDGACPNGCIESFNRVTGSDYTSNSFGDHRVYVNATDGVSCPGAGNVYYLRSVKEVAFFPDTYGIPKSYTCGVVSYRSWTWGADNFHLDIAKQDDTPDNNSTWTSKGHTHYP